MSAAIGVALFIVGWLACAVCAIRLFDLAADGMDEDDRFIALVFAFVVAPFALVVALGFYAYYRLSTGRTAAVFGALLYPGHTRNQRRLTAADALSTKAVEYRRLAAKAADPGERRLLNDVADTYMRQADELAQLRGRR